MAVLDKELFINTIKDSIEYLVNWFSRSDYFLILKAHPNQKNKMFPKNPYVVKDIIRELYGNKIPDNIIYLEPDVKLSAYTLYEKSSLTITWTGTSSIESTMYGTPSIVLAKAHYRGKGFTIDPSTTEELSEMLEKCLSNNFKLNDAQIDLAKKYFYLWQFKLSKDVGIPTMRYGKRPTDLKWKTAEEYLENKNLEKVINEISFKQEISA